MQNQYHAGWRATSRKYYVFLSGLGQGGVKMAAFFKGVCQELSVHGEFLTSTGDTNGYAGFRCQSTEFRKSAGVLKCRRDRC